MAGVFNPVDEGQAAELRRLIAEHGLSAAADRITAAAMNAVQFIATSPGPDAPVGAGRMGGLPDVPPGFVWPDGMSFLLQLDLRDMAPLDVNGLLPRSGLLSLFLGDDERQGDVPHRVMFFDAEPAALRRAAPPAGYLPIAGGHGQEAGEPPQVVYDPYRLAGRQSISLPSSYSRAFSELWPDDDSFEDEYEALRSALDWPRPSGRVGLHQLLGYDSAAADGAGVLACFTRAGIDPDLYWLTPERAEALIAEPEARRNKSSHDTYLLARRREQRDALVRLGPRLDEVRRQVDDWALLLEVDSDLNVGTCFWDAGQIHVMIRKEDLAALRFDQTYMALSTL